MKRRMTEMVSTRTGVKRKRMKQKNPEKDKEKRKNDNKHKGDDERKDKGSHHIGTTPHR
jgi:hypothetical protein